MNYVFKIKIVCAFRTKINQKSLCGVTYFWEAWAGNLPFLPVIFLYYISPGIYTAFDVCDYTHQVCLRTDLLMGLYTAEDYQNVTLDTE